MRSRVVVEKQRANRSRESAVGRIDRMSSHLVVLMQIVEPRPVDESMLQANRGNTAAARFEHNRAAPSARFCIRYDHFGPQRVKSGARFVYRARRPGPLKKRNAGQFF